MTTPHPSASIGLASAMSGWRVFLALPIVLVLAIAGLVLVESDASAATAPVSTTSYYVRSTNPTTFYNYGKSLGSSDRLNGRYDTHVVILEFGIPTLQGATYGVTLPDGFGFRDYSQIRPVAEEFANGYYANNQALGGVDDLRVVVGTNNYGSAFQGSDANAKAYQEGLVWAHFTQSVEDTVVRRGQSAHLVINGGSDIELGFNLPIPTRQWMAGYQQNGTREFRYFGDASGCPPVGGCDNTWSEEDVFYVSHGSGAGTNPIPQIYNQQGTNAQQWAQVGFYSYAHHSSHLYFAGTLTQYQACAGRTCTGTRNTASQGWTQLYNEINLDSRTAGGIDWSTDIAYSSTV